MTRPLRSSSIAPGGYTRLERAVMEALAADLRAAAPDFAQQFAAGRPTVRRNSGFGVFTEMSPSSRPPTGQASGDLGTVHVMVGNLPDPIAFTARLQDGQLVGLMGDSYGQDTRQIDFATVPFSQIFTVDDSGRSIPFPSASAPPEPQARSTPRPAPLMAEVEALRRAIAPTNPPMANVLQRVQDHAKADQSTIMLARTVAPPDAIAPDGAPSTDATSLLIGAWAIIGAIAIVVDLLTDLPWPFILVIAIWVGSALRKPKTLSALKSGVDKWNASQANAGG